MDRTRLPGHLLEDHHLGGRDLTEWRTRVGQLLAQGGTRLAARLGPHVALVAMLLAAGLLVTGLTAASTEIYEEVADGDAMSSIDRPVLDAAVALRSDVANDVVTAYTDLGGPVLMPVLTAVVTVALALRWRRWTPVVLVAAAAAGSLAMTVVGKPLVGRTRPPVADAVPPYEMSAAFPSGHALNATVIAGVVAYLLVRRQHTARARTLTLVAAGVFAVTMGLSRVFLGHHWLTDVVVAWTLGLAWLTLVVVAHRLYLTAHRRGVHSRQAG